MKDSVSAVIIRDKDNKVFIGKRSLNKEYSPGEWETIGGRVEKGEKIEEALEREVREELNVKIEKVRYFKDYSFEGRTFKHFIIKLKNEPKPNKDDFEDWGWFNREEIKNKEFAINCKEKLLDYFEYAK